ncbi:MAG: cytidylate kinase-like family protein [Candidatus Binataceae bacterium]
MAIITISRGTMSGGEGLANRVAETLGYPCLAREVLVEAAAKLGVPERELRWSVGYRGTPWERLTVDRRIYLTALQAGLSEHCVSGNLVYHGNAGHLLLEGLRNVLKVRLIAPMEQRVRALMRREGLRYSQARDFVECSDRDRKQWTKFVYGLDWSSPELYDLVINLRDINLETACDIVSATAKLPAYAVTEEVRKQLVDFALDCRVKLALADDVRTRNAEFGVVADDGKVEIFAEMAGAGLLPGRAGPNEEDVLLVAHKVEGVKAATVSFHRHAKSADAQAVDR